MEFNKNKLVQQVLAQIQFLKKHQYLSSAIKNKSLLLNSIKNDK